MGCTTSSRRPPRQPDLSEQQWANFWNTEILHYSEVEWSMISQYEMYFIYLYQDMATPQERRDKIKSFLFYRRLIDQRNVISSLGRLPEIRHTSQAARDYYNTIMADQNQLNAHLMLTGIRDL